MIRGFAIGTFIGIILYYMIFLWFLKMEWLYYVITAGFGVVGLFGSISEKFEKWISGFGIPIIAAYCIMRGLTLIPFFGYPNET